MKGSKVDPDVLARAVVEAATVGDAKAAATHGISVRTIRRARERLGKGAPELSEAVREKVAKVDLDWRASRVQALRAVADRIKAVAVKETDLSKLAAAFRALGDVDLTSAALGVGTNAGPAAESSTPPEASSGPREGQRSPEERLGLQ